MQSQQKMMGFETPGDQKVPITVRDWNAMRLGLWRSKGAWEIAAREAADILVRCRHAHGCPGEQSETSPCLADQYEKPTTEGDVITPGVRTAEGCPDREIRMSALVVLNAARTLAPVDARRPAADPYMAPSREYFSEVMAELASAQIERDMLREMLRTAGIEVPAPPTRELTTEERLQEVQ